MAVLRTAGDAGNISTPETKTCLHQYSCADDQNQTPEDRLIGEAECRKLTGLSRSTRFRLEAQGKFPKRCKPTPSLCRWSLREIEIWRDRLLSDRGAR